jgi:biopolymer transport protein ExbD
MTLYKNRRKNTIVSEINITPFTDIVLVLLIIFMITTPMFMQSNIKINLPKTQISNPDNENSSNIEVLISKGGCVYIEGNQIHNSNIESVMCNFISLHPDVSVIIRGDKEVQYNYIVQFMDKAKKAGVVKFALAVDNIVSSR